MWSKSASARQKAARFLALAMEARANEDFELAELLTDAATAAFNKAEAEEAAASSALTTEQQQAPVQQQQQQVQPDDGPDNQDPNNKE
jgi:hypothetical protein